MVVASAAPKLSLQCEAIAADTTTIRSLDWDRSRFDIEFGLRNGTTYNAFLVRGERTALIDTSHAKFRDTWIPLLKEQIDPSAIDVLIVSHTEPDHSGLIGDLIDLNPEIEIVGSKVALQFLQDQVHRPFKSCAVKSGQELDLGTNPDSGIQHRFEFLSAPNLHWPDTIFSFDHGTGILYTCDAFGLHYCSDDVFDADPGAIAPDFRFYYDCLMGPNARSVLQALKRMDGLPEINSIAVGHGPLLRHHLSHWISDYREWSGQRSKGESYAAVCYLSQYGFSDRISQAIAHGIGKADAQVQLVDLRATDPQELTALIGDAKAVVVPTWPAEPEPDLQASIGTLLAALHPRRHHVVHHPVGVVRDVLERVRRFDDAVVAVARAVVAHALHRARVEERDALVGARVDAVKGDRRLGHVLQLLPQADAFEARLTSAPARETRPRWTRVTARRITPSVRRPRR